MSEGYCHDEKKEALFLLWQILKELKAGNNNKSIEALATRMDAMEEKLMSQLSEFSDRVETQFTAIGESVDGLVASIGGLDRDVGSLKAQIADLQNSTGGVTPEDQARLDKIEAALTALAGKTSAVASAAAALDQQTETPPTP